MTGSSTPYLYQTEHFNVTVNGLTFLTNFDAAAQAGGAFRAVDRTMILFGTNQIVIAFTPVVSAPKVNAIEIYQ